MKVGCIVCLNLSAEEITRSGWKPQGRMKVVRVSRHSAAVKDEVGKVFVGEATCFKVLSYGDTDEQNA